MRPRCLRVHVVGRDRRHAPPVVDARPDQAAEGVRAQVRRGLDRHVGTEDQPRAGDGPLEVLQRRVGRLRHPRVRLGPEVLDDDLLDVAAPVVEVAQREERVDAFLARLADPDQDPRRVGNGQPPPPGAASPAARPGPCRATRGGPVPVPGRRRETLSSIIPCEGHTSRSASSSSRVQTPGLACGSRPVASEHGARGGHEVRNRRRVAERVELGARLRVAELRFCRRA